MSTSIQLKSLSKVYNDTNTLAVDNIDLEINKGEVFGLLGPNGAGKTTVISILCSLLSPSEGDVFVDGLNLTKNLTEIREIIGVVPQDIALYSDLTARENLTFFGNMYGLSGNELSDRIKNLLEVFGLSHKSDFQVSSFSGGMKRRVNLIAGILHMPKILFLDEPTVGIDVQSRSVIMDYLIQLQQNGMTIIYTSHHMEEAEKYCTRIAIIDKGKIIEEGKPKNLVQKYDKCNNLEDIFLKLTGRSLRD